MSDLITKVGSQKCGWFDNVFTGAGSCDIKFSGTMEDVAQMTEKELGFYIKGYKRMPLSGDITYVVVVNPSRVKDLKMVSTGNNRKEDAESVAVFDEQSLAYTFSVPYVFFASGKYTRFQVVDNQGRTTTVVIKFTDAGFQHRGEGCSQ